MKNKRRRIFKTRGRTRRRKSTQRINKIRSKKKTKRMKPKRKIMKGGAEEHVWPDHFNCPITHDVMKDPVTTRGDIEKAAGSGEYSVRTYERAAIEEWIRQHPPGSDPYTREPLLATDLVPNEALKREMWEAGVRPLLGAETSRGGGKKNKSRKRKSRKRKSRKRKSRKRKTKKNKK